MGNKSLYYHPGFTKFEDVDFNAISAQGKVKIPKDVIDAFEEKIKDKIKAKKPGAQFGIELLMTSDTNYRLVLSNLGSPYFEEWQDKKKKEAAIAQKVKNLHSELSTLTAQFKGYLAAADKCRKAIGDIGKLFPSLEAMSKMDSFNQESFNRKVADARIQLRKAYDDNTEKLEEYLKWHQKMPTLQSLVSKEALTVNDLGAEKEKLASIVQELILPEQDPVDLHAETRKTGDGLEKRLEDLVLLVAKEQREGLKEAKDDLKAMEAELASDLKDLHFDTLQGKLDELTLALRNRNTSSVYRHWIANPGMITHMMESNRRAYEDSKRRQAHFAQKWAVWNRKKLPASCRIREIDELVDEILSLQKKHTNRMDDIQLLLSDQNDRFAELQREAADKAAADKAAADKAKPARR